MIPAHDGLTVAHPGRSSLAGVLGAVWGIAGIAGLLGYAIVRLAGHVVGGIAVGMGPLEWGLLAGNVAFMTWAEGIRGFQRRFAPRVAARALVLLERPEPWAVLLAPFFCVGYFRANPGLQRMAWVGTLLIVLAVLAVQQVGQPWRGILDAGVVAGLSWGTVAVLVQGVQVLRQRRATVAPEIPVP
jgi:hypothetical protein